MDSLRDSGINPANFNRLTLLETRGGNPKINTLDNLRILRPDTVFDLEPVHRYRPKMKRETRDHGSTIKVSNLQSNSRPAEAGPGHRDAKRPLLHSFADVPRSDIAHRGERTDLAYGIPGSSTLQSAAKGPRLGAGYKSQISENTNLGELQHTAETSVFCSTTREGDTRSDPQSPGSTTLPSASNPPNPNLAISERDTRSTPAGSDTRMEGPTAGRSTLNWLSGTETHRTRLEILGLEVSITPLEHQNQILLASEDVGIKSEPGKEECPRRTLFQVSCIHCSGFLPVGILRGSGLKGRKLIYLT